MRGPTGMAMCIGLCLAQALGAGAAEDAAAARKLAPHYDELAGLPYEQGYLAHASIALLRDELLFQRAVQSYLWALPVLNMLGMQEGSEKVFGRGYNVLPIWKDRLNTKTRITTPNSDVIYALGYLDLKADGPLVIEVPPGLQGILDDFFQRPICSEEAAGGRRWCGDIGLPGPDKGQGGKYLLLPPDYRDAPPPGYFTMRSRTYGVFVFWRGFFKDPRRLEEPVKVMEQTRIYPLGKEDSARPMRFPNASQTPLDMLYPTDGSAFDMLARFIEHEYADPADREMRGMLAALGIVKGRPFEPDAHTRALLDRAARTASRIGHTLAYDPEAAQPGARWYADRRWLNPFPGNPTFSGDTFNFIDARAGFFTYAYSTSPGMAVNMEKVGAKYPVTYVDADGEFLTGERDYRLRLPKNIPAALFWSVTVYDPVTGAGLDNGQPFPSINSMDRPLANADGSTDIHFGADSPGAGRNWLRTPPGKGFFVMLRLYGPTRAFFDQSWKPGDLEKIR